MNWSLGDLLSEMSYSLQSPRAGIRRVIASDPPMSARWIGLLLAAIASTFLMVLSLRLVPEDEIPPSLVLAMQSPVSLALIQAATLWFSAYALFWLGRFRGGRGSFADSLAVLVWFQLMMLCVQAVLLGLQVLVPPLAGVAFLAGITLFFWLLTNFVAELHGFRSLGATFLGLLIALVALIILLGFGLAVVMALTVGAPPS